MRNYIAYKCLQNGRWGVHHVSVTVGKSHNGSDEILYRNGWSDPLVCETVDQAMGYFNARNEPEADRFYWERTS